MAKLMRKRINGFSIVEIVVVCVIIMICLVPVFTLMSRGSSGTIRNRNEILAQQYASNFIAYANALPFDSEKLKEMTDKNINELSISKTDGSIIDNIDKTEEIFNRFVTIKDFPPTDYIPYKYKVVTVKVEWQQKGETIKRNVTMSGLVTER